MLHSMMITCVWGLQSVIPDCIEHCLVKPYVTVTTAIKTREARTYVATDIIDENRLPENFLARRNFQFSERQENESERELLSQEYGNAQLPSHIHH